MNVFTNGSPVQPVTVEEAYSSILVEYPDVMNVHQISEILMISTKTCYALIRDGELHAIKVGRSFRVPKLDLFNYLNILAV